MRTILTLIFALFIVFNALCQPLTMPTSPIRERLVKATEKYVGLKEATGHNDGVGVEAILANVGLGKGFAWCAALMAQGHDDAQVRNPHSAYCPDWFKTNVVFDRDKHKIENFQAKKGMVYGLWIANKGRVGHVGMTYAESKFSYSGIEGNTNDAGSDEGEGCYRKLRNKRSIKVFADYAMSPEECQEFLKLKKGKLL